jgi:hypothetical protein
MINKEQVTIVDSVTEELEEKKANSPSYLLEQTGASK